MSFISAPMPVFFLEEAPLQQQLQQQHCCQQQQRQHQAHTVFNGQHLTSGCIERLLD